MNRLLLVLFCALVLVPSSAMAGNPHLIAVDSARTFWEIDVTTGTKTQFATISANAGMTAGLAIGAANTIYVSSSGNDALYTVDPATGTATLVGPYGNAALVMHGLEYVAATDTLYGVSSHDNGLYVIDKATGAATLVGTSGLSSFTNLGWDSLAGIMYATNSGADSFYTINLSTGAATLVGPLNGPTNPNGLAFDADANVLYLVDNTTDTLYTINRATGVATPIGSTGSGNLLGLAWLNGSLPVELLEFAID